MIYKGDIDKLPSLEGLWETKPWELYGDIDNPPPFGSGDKIICINLGRSFASYVPGRIYQVFKDPYFERNGHGQHWRVYTTDTEKPYFSANGLFAAAFV